jgi:hypothetical protein
MSLRTGDGIAWRVSPGAKTERDLVLEVRTANGWRNVKMETGFLMADFLAENEDVLVADGYFPAASAGADYYLNFLRIAATDGWQAAAERLEAERQARRKREAAPDNVPVLAAVVCATCGAAPTGTFSNGSPRFACGPHLPVLLAAAGASLEDIF